MSRFRSTITVRTSGPVEKVRTVVVSILATDPERKRYFVKLGDKRIGSVRRATEACSTRWVFESQDGIVSADSWERRLGAVFGLLDTVGV